MSVEREMSLAEWCAKLPNQHKVNQELAVLNKQLAALAEQNKQLKAELKSIDGALNDPRANLTLTTSEIIWELKGQIERLTDAYDQCGRTVQEYGRAIDQTESRLREVAAHCANVEQQLAAPTPPVSEDRWQPIATAPEDRFVLLAGPSGYTTIETVFATGRMCSDYHVGRWIDHANDDLTDWGFEPTHWMPLPKAPAMQEDKP
jgi:chaperonin cofactor prefoldin